MVTADGFFGVPDPRIEGIDQMLFGVRLRNIFGLSQEGELLQAPRADVAEIAVRIIVPFNQEFRIGHLPPLPDVAQQDGLVPSGLLQEKEAHDEGVQADQGHGPARQGLGFQEPMEEVNPCGDGDQEGQGGKADHQGIGEESRSRVYGGHQGLDEQADHQHARGEKGVGALFHGGDQRKAEGAEGEDDQQPTPHPQHFSSELPPFWSLQYGGQADQAQRRQVAAQPQQFSGGDPPGGDGQGF